GASPRIESRGPGGSWLICDAMYDLAVSHGFTHDKRDISQAMERRSSTFHAGFLRAIFDANGTISGGGNSAALSVRYTGLTRLQAIQRMLLRLGVVSAIEAEADGFGLTIVGDDMFRYAERIGFSDGGKVQRLPSVLGRPRSLNRERFCATV